MQSRFIQIKYCSNILIIPFIRWVFGVSAVLLAALLPFTIHRRMLFCFLDVLLDSWITMLLALLLWTVLFISLWSTTAETKNGLLDANKSACLRFLVLRTKTIRWWTGLGFVVLWECFYSFLHRFIGFSPPVWLQSLLQMWCGVPLTEHWVVHQVLIPLSSESLTEKKPVGVTNGKKPEDAGLVYLCLNIITATFQQLRRPPAWCIQDTWELQERRVPSSGSSSFISRLNRLPVSFQKPAWTWTLSSFPNRLKTLLTDVHHQINCCYDTHLQTNQSEWRRIEVDLSALSINFLNKVKNKVPWCRCMMGTVSASLYFCRLLLIPAF